MKIAISLKNSIKKNIMKCLGLFYTNGYSFCIKKNKSLKGTYKLLACIAVFSPQKFKIIKQYNDKKNLEKIKHKRNYNFAFVVYTSTLWNVNGLCKLLCENPKINTEIIVARRPIDKKFTNKEYLETISYFINLGYSVVEAHRIKDINKYDMLFYLDPTALYEKTVSFMNIPLSIMVFHTSYSFMLAGNKEKLGTWMYHLAYKYYTDSLFYKKEIDNHIYSTNNTAFCGFPKMDQYYAVNCSKRTEKTVIIYAPHHSVDYNRYRAATFKDNYLAILEMAKKYNEKTFWIYKPHPRLRDASVIAGIFGTVDEYDKYEDQWRQLQNGRVVNSGDYFVAFKESDAMITDSVSFLAEYQYTHKPLLLLNSGMEEYNDFGNSIIEILYKCDGADLKSIELFIENCIKGEDSMRKERESFFNQNLDCVNDGISANKKIYMEICSLLQ